MQNILNMLERHVEKIVLVLVIVVLLGALTLQFVGDADTVEVGGREVALDQAWDPVQEQAEALRAGIESSSDELEGLEEIENRPGEAQNFRESLLAQGALRQMEIGNLPRPGGLDPVSGAGPDAQYRVSLQQPPAPTDVIAREHLGTIHPQEVMRAPGLAAYLNEQPYDSATVSVEAKFSGAAFRETLVTDPDGPDGELDAIPDIWLNGVQPLVVRLERQRQIAPGVWGETEAVGPAPGQFWVGDEIAEAQNAAQARGAVQRAAQNEWEVVQPRFYSVMFGPEWTPPSERTEEVENPLLKFQAQQIGGELREAMARLDEFNKQLADPDLSQEERRAIEVERRPADREVRRLQNQLRQRNLDWREVLADLEAAELAEREAQGTSGRETREPLGELLEQDALSIWAHDVTVERGETYRYRLTLVMTNPLAGREAALASEAHEAAGQPVITSLPSAWTEPVSVAAETYTFITQAALPDEVSPRARATAEVFVFRWGHWRRGASQVRPGDVVMASVSSPQFQTIPMEGGDPPPPPQGPDDVPPMEDVLVQADLMLLDVVVEPGERGAGAVRAVMRERDGSLSVRSRAGEIGRPLYERLLASHQAGQAALRPREAAPPDDPGGDDVPPDRPRERDGGGGGGGG